MRLESFVYKVKNVHLKNGLGMVSDDQNNFFCLAGRRCGNFLSRCLIYCEDKDRFIEGKDFCIGQDIILNKHCFVIISADEFTLNFLEEHPDEVILLALYKTLIK